MKPDPKESLADVPAPRESLTELMRAGTRLLHARAERSGVINDVLRGRASRYAYALLLRNLRPAYGVLEAGLETFRHVPAVRAVADRGLYRARAIESDLYNLYGDEWEQRLPLLPAGQEYARRVATAAQGDGTRLIAHAYARYFGDLSGGPVLKRLLSQTPGLRPDQLSFFDFPEIDDGAAFKDSYRRAINAAAATIADIDAVIAEAAVAFELNIRVSEAVQKAAAAAA